MSLALSLRLISPIDRFNQRAYMIVARKLLRLHGVEVVGQPLWISSRVYWDRSGGIRIGDRCVISHDVRLLTHDFSMDRVAELKEGESGRELSRRAPIHIGDHAFIGMGVTILPGVSIGAGAIVGTGSVVVKNVEAGTVVAGNPAREIASTEDYWERKRGEFSWGTRRK